MASIDDLVTVQKNGVVAINALTAALETFRAVYASFVGTNTYLGITESSLITNGPGRLVNVSVTVGVSGGLIHDANSIQAATPENAIFAIPSNAGVTQVNIPVFNGIVVVPASGSTVNITYS